MIAAAPERLHVKITDEMSDSDVHVNFGHLQLEEDEELSDALTYFEEKLRNTPQTVDTGDTTQKIEQLKAELNRRGFDYR